MALSQYVETLNLLGDESRIRLCALLRERELCVSDLVRVTGIAQSRVSTHLGRLREAGFVWDRRQGTQCFYGLSLNLLPDTARAVLDEAAKSSDPTLLGDQKRLQEMDAERRGGLPESALDDLERYYSPGRTWQSLAVGIAAFLKLGDVLDVGSGDGAAAASLAPYCKSLTCIDTSARMIESAKERLAKFAHARAAVADVHALPFADESFDSVLMFHTLTYAEAPERALAECARVLRPGGKIVLLCLNEHQQHEVTARYGERHPGFSPQKVGELLARAGLELKSSEIACREVKKPHLEVVLASADKPRSASKKKLRAS
ncbi:MAG TPA: metalloregulator ArsR/SmtB family transcription factor [Polyangiaceae bacterium]|jgi:ArsR family transcriptional regulator|nr:metalloregulator ArsR/SmtB family transcription factor [Polyangiaceae bacterium]